MTGFKQIDDARKLLGLDEAATLKEIKDAYRDLALKYHPDKCKGGFVVISAYKFNINKSKIYKKFSQYEKIRFLFKRYGYDMEEARQRVLERAGPIKEPILDVGTGPGRMAYTLARHGYKVTTIDISKEAQEVAKIYAEKYKVLTKIKFINMDAQNMKFKDGSFATVISANLLHDVKDPSRVVCEAIRVTQAKGRIVISDLNRKGKFLVNKVYKINKEVHRAKPVDLEGPVGENFKKNKIPFKKYNDGYITTYCGEKKK